MANTGRLIYRKLEQYNTLTGEATGVVKDNVEGTEGYVPPIEGTTQCPIEGQTFTLKLLPAYVRVPNAGSSVNIDIRSNVSWKVNFTNTSFINLFGQTLEGNGNGSINFMVHPHTFSGGPRHLYVSVTSIDEVLEDTCHVEQDPYNSGGVESGPTKPVEPENPTNPTNPEPYDPTNPGGINP